MVWDKTKICVRNSGHAVLYELAFLFAPVKSILNELDAWLTSFEGAFQAGQVWGDSG